MTFVEGGVFEGCETIQIVLETAELLLETAGNRLGNSLNRLGHGSVDANRLGNWKESSWKEETSS